MPKREFDRHAVVILWQQCLSIAAIQRRTGKSRSYITRWIERYKRTGDVTPVKQLGRPRVYTKKVHHLVVRHIKGKRKRSPHKVAHLLRHKWGNAPSEATIRRIIKEANLIMHRRKRRPLLTARAIKKRLAFIAKYRRADWSSVIFCDEKHWPLQAPLNWQNDVIWDSADAEYIKEEVQRTPSLRVWAAITCTGKTSLHFYDCNLNAIRYQQLLEEARPELDQLHPGRQWTLLQDNAPAHAAKKTQEWLARNFPAFIPKADWPANSPDLNPIENLWSIVAEEVYATDSRTLAELRRKLESAWARVSPALVEKLCDSMPHRFQQVKTNEGRWSGY